MSSAVPLNLGIARSAGTAAAGQGRRVLLAEPRGYCAGVDRAVETVEKALEKHGAPIYVRKEIVHNRHVVDTLAERGVIFAEETDEVPEGSVLVFSAHGVAPSVRTNADARHLRTIDATCPLVTKVHVQARRYAVRVGYLDLLSFQRAAYHLDLRGSLARCPNHFFVSSMSNENDGAALFHETYRLQVHLGDERARRIDDFQMLCRRRGAYLGRDSMGAEDGHGSFRDLV